MASYDATELSLIHKRPYLRLAAAMVGQAVKDYHSDDIEKSLDALNWWTDQAAIWLDLLGFEYEPVEVFLSLVAGHLPQGKRFEVG